MKQKTLALLLALSLVTALLTGCGTAGAGSAQSASEAQTSTVTDEPAAASTQEDVEAPQEDSVAPESSEADVPEDAQATISYPLEGDNLTLSVFTSFPSNLTSYMSTFADHPGFQAAQEATGVTIDFTEVGMENAATQFELMVASDSFTDIVIGFDDMYVGGVTAAYEGDLIYDIADDIAEYAPDYLRTIESQPSYQDIVYQKDGTMLGVYGLYLYDYTAVSSGIFIRQDWLDDLGLDTPVTYDDWYDVLTAFKDEKGADAALLLPNGSESRGAIYAGGYGTAGYSTDARMTAQHFYQVDGVVTSSLVDDNYLAYLTMLHQWYEEGLIYNDFYSNETRDIMDPLIYGGNTGIFDGKVDYITKYETGDTTGTLRLTGIAPPVEEAGDVNPFGTYVSEKSSASITTTCESVDVALEWMNYFFTDEGILLANYGEEGVSYTMGADGPEFTDLILHNEDSELQFGNVTRLYLLDEVLPTVYDQTRELAAYSEAEQNAIEVWSNSSEAIYTLPDLILSSEANEELTSYLVDVETYASENIIKFIIGDKDLADWSSFVDTLKGMGIDRCIEIYQEALDEA
jgi:putative aldouronate transport system substrate-binding protein